MQILKPASVVGAILASITPAYSSGISPAKITGPIPVTAQSGEPFRGLNEQPVAGPGLPLPVLQPYGYVEEEYFVSGTVDGKPYATSLLVRKPKDPAKFSGVVAVETLHAQGAIPFWGQRDVLMPGNHGWVMVVSQRSALEAFNKKSNAARYASLQIPEAPAAASANPMAPGPQDAISQEIMSQVGALLKSNASNGPFAGMKVKYLIMGGSSQTGMTTLRYIQESHAKARLPDGKPIYDGYLPMEAFALGPLTGGDAAVVHVVGEGDFGLFRAFSRGAAFTIRADSDAPNDRFREYEFPAASHVPTRGIADPKVIFPTLENVVNPGEHLSQFPSPPFYNAALVNLINWISKGISPPKAPPIEMANGEIVRDEYGNAKGGVRTPYVDLPTVRYIASAPAGEPANMVRRMIGLQEAIPAEKLQSMYKSRAQYLMRFDEEIDRLVAQHWLQSKDGEQLKADEAKNPPF
ncbi:MAG: alpha/beta hydrolase domain-containing protein [Steroidobacteraceae bacterium]